MILLSKSTKAFFFNLDFQGFDNKSLKFMLFEMIQFTNRLKLSVREVKNLGIFRPSY